MSGEPPNYYALLGVKPDASVEEIHQAFARLQLAQQKSGATGDVLKQASYAYEVLSDPSRRALYDSLLQETTSSPTLKLNAMLSRTRVGLMNTPQILYLMLEVRPPQQQEDTHLPLNLCLVLDQSTSMRGARLNRMQAAVEKVLEKLGPDDVISIVGFSDRAQVLVPAGTAQEKSRVLARVKGMTASGGTEIYQGLQTGVAEMRRLPLGRYLNHLILLTDGHTYGDESLCLQLAKETAAQGIGITAFGIGHEWNDQFLDRLVTPSGGQSGYIEQPEEIVKHLDSRIKGLGSVYAQDVRLLLNFPESIFVRYGFKMTPYAQPIAIDAKEIKLGDIEGRQPLSILLELSLGPQLVENRITLPVSLRAEIPTAGAKVYTFKQDLSLLVLSKPLPEEPPETLLKAVRMLSMYRLNEKVWEDMESGNVEMATRRMQHLSTRFFEAGQTRLAHQAQMEVERLANLQNVSGEGSKALKYGTRMLFTQTMSLMLSKSGDLSDDQVS